jgi:hypothetical protein
MSLEALGLGGLDFDALIDTLDAIGHNVKRLIAAAEHEAI